MNFIVICLHCLDMRDFHSMMRETPFLDELRAKSVFMPTGRGQGHHQRDSLNAEMTGSWTARHCDSLLTKTGYKRAQKFWLPKTVIEYLREDGYDILTCIGCRSLDNMGSAAVECGMKELWLKDEPDRLQQFISPHRMDRDELFGHLDRSKKFYAHVMLRETHRPWGQPEGLGAIVGEPPGDWPHDAFCARKSALERPDEFAALRRRGLAKADAIVKQIFEQTNHLKNVTYVVYSNHGEVFDHFRYNIPYENTGGNMIEGTSHGPYPYEALYANMQMWVIPGQPAKLIRGIGRSIDFAPTILDLAGAPHGRMDGESMLSHFAEGVFPDRDRYAETGRGHAISMVRADGYKFLSTGMVKKRSDEPMYGPDYHRLAVFDLKFDPNEYSNLIDTHRGQEVLKWAIDRHSQLKR